MPSASSASCNVCATSASSRGVIWSLSSTTRDLGAEAAEHLAELEAEVVAAEHDQVLGHLSPGP